MQYLFRGLRRGIGEPVAGRIVAPNEDVAYSVLDSHDIVVDSMMPESAPAGAGTSTPRPPLLAQALEDALEEAGLRIRFDQLARYHEGHSVWVVDQGKVRRRVMQLVDEAIGDDESRQHARQHIAQVLEKLFDDRPGVGPDRSDETLELKSEISRLTAVVARMERAMASLSVTARRGRPSEQRASEPHRAARDRTHEEVLIEIFESNLELMRGTRRRTGAEARGSDDR